MATKDTILNDLKEAMKARDAARLQVLRSLKAKILEKEISLRSGGKAEISEEQVVEVLVKAAKQRRESIDQFEKGGREDLAQTERAELEIIESYLPAQMGEEEIRATVRQGIEETGAAGMQDMGRLMGLMMGRLKGKADGSAVNRIVKEELGAL
ncbi:MAG: glutamyl-tRNA amidotransferase [Bacteroidetes bacterium]|nr:MAG: glutamyl-tRNA amidotransferase [Bacteroidota bacterium]